MRVLALLLSVFAMPVSDKPDLRKECEAFLESLDVMSEITLS